MYKVNVLIYYDLMINIVSLGRGRRGGVIFKSFRGVGPREVYVLINCNLMIKDGSDREEKERLVGDVFEFEGWGYGVWTSGCVGGRCFDRLCTNVLTMYAC